MANPVLRCAVKKSFVLPIAGLVLALSSCVVDRYGRVYPAPIAVGFPGPVVAAPAYYGDPYFVYGGIYYYNYGGRYFYYDHGRRVFASRLPRGGRYLHGGGRVVM